MERRELALLLHGRRSLTAEEAAWLQRIAGRYRFGVPPLDSAASPRA